MNWHQNRHQLKHSVTLLGPSPGKKEKTWRKKRQQVLNKYKYICGYCGGHYLKYLHVIHKDGDNANVDDDNLEICCKLCYFITHLNLLFNNIAVLCYSKMDQKTINQKTTDYVMKYSEVPKASKIDPKAELIELSLLEYVNILFAKDIKTPKHFKNYKVFFTNNLDVTFITINPAATCIFIDSEEIVDSYESYSDEDLVQYDFSKEEEVFLKKFFGNNSEQTKVDKIIANVHFNEYLAQQEEFKEICQDVFSTN